MFYRVGRIGKVPSPKSQNEAADIGTDVLVKLAEAPRQTVAGALKSDTTSL